MVSSEIVKSERITPDEVFAPGQNPYQKNDMIPEGYVFTLPKGCLLQDPIVLSDERVRDLANKEIKE